MKSGKLFILSTLAFILGIFYVLAVILAIYLWITQSPFSSQFLYYFVPKDVSSVIILAPIGLVLSSSLYYVLRRDVVKSIACLLIGGGIGTIAMIIQTLVVFANIVDATIMGEKLSIEKITVGLLRADSSLGWAAFLLFLTSILLYRKLRNTLKNNL